MKFPPAPFETPISVRRPPSQGRVLTQPVPAGRPSITFGQGEKPPSKPSGGSLSNAWQSMWPFSTTNRLKTLLAPFPAQESEVAQREGVSREALVEAAMSQENPFAWGQSVLMAIQGLPLEEPEVLKHLLPLLKRSSPLEMIGLAAMLQSLKQAGLFPSEAKALESMSKLTEKSGEGVSPVRWFAESMPALMVPMEDPKTRRHVFYNTSRLYESHVALKPDTPLPLALFFENQLKPVARLWKQVVGPAPESLKETRGQSVLQFWLQMFSRVESPAELPVRLDVVNERLEAVHDKPYLATRHFQFASWIKRFENLPAVLDAHTTLYQAGRVSTEDDKFLITLENKTQLSPPDFKKLLTDIVDLFADPDPAPPTAWATLSSLREFLKPGEETLLVPMTRLFLENRLEVSEKNVTNLKNNIQRFDSPEAFFAFVQEQTSQFETLPELRPVILDLLFHPVDQRKRIQAIGHVVAALAKDVQEGQYHSPEPKVVAAMIKFTSHIQVSLEAFQEFWDKTMADMRTHQSPKTLEVASQYQKGFDDPRLFIRTFPMVLNIPPEKRVETVRFAEKCVREVYRHIKEEPPNTQHGDVDKFTKNLQFLLHLQAPTELLNAYMLNRDAVLFKTVHRLYKAVDFTIPVPVGKQILPELMAMMEPYFASLEHMKPKERKEYVEQVSMAITRLYHYLYSGKRIDTIEPVVLESWSKVGTVGLSFSKWQYDTMVQWKGQGPMQKPSLFEQSGIFTRIPSREDDAKYFGGFVHRDPEKGLSIEMRRAYIVISKKDVGTLVIRNSSPVFGRDLLNEPGYFNAHKTFHEDNAYFDPSILLENVYHKGSDDWKKGAQADDYNYKKDDFASVLSKYLNQTSLVQRQNQGKVIALMNDFESVMEQYIAWKCNFKDGTPPEGMKRLMEAALGTAKDNGAGSPYGKKKNLRLAWVPPHGLPYTVAAFDLSQKPLQEELAFYLNSLNKKAYGPQLEDFETKIPNLLAFFRQGLAQGYELILKE